jgi:hypothetical protein
VTGWIGYSDRLNYRLIDISVEVIVVVTVWYTLIFQGGWTGQGKGVVASFRLELENQGVVASFRLLESGGCILLHFEKSGGCSLLLVGAREFREL